MSWKSEESTFNVQHFQIIYLKSRLMYTFNALSDAAFTHPQRFKTFSFLQQPQRYARAVSLNEEHPLMLSLIRFGQPWAKAYKDRSLSLKLLLRSSSSKSWQLFAIVSTALSTSCGLSWRRTNVRKFLNLGASERTKLFMFFLHLQKQSSKKKQT